jgi:hypothetical protein
MPSISNGFVISESLVTFLNLLQKTVNIRKGCVELAFLSGERTKISYAVLQVCCVGCYISSCQITLFLLPPIQIAHFFPFCILSMKLSTSSL